MHKMSQVPEGDPDLLIRQELLFWVLPLVVSFWSCPVDVGAFGVTAGEIDVFPDPGSRKLGFLSS